MGRAVNALPWLMVGLALWPTAQFCLNRVRTSDDAACLVLSLGAALVVSVHAARRRSGTMDQRAVTAAMLAYAACLWWVTPLGAALAGMAALGVALGTRAFGRVLQPGLLLLLALALPVIPTLEFTLGHPLRLLATHGAYVLLGMLGQAVEPVGTCLRGDHGVVCVDAPCAGVRMLWTAAWCAGAVSSWNAASWGRTAWLGGWALVAVLLGNMMRTASLFIAETRMVVPPWMHEGVGLTAFALVMASVVAVGWRMKGGASCVASPV